MVSKLCTLQPHHVMWKLGEKTPPKRDVGLDVVEICEKQMGNFEKKNWQQNPGIGCLFPI